MPIYITLTTFTEQGRKIIRDNPERIKGVNKEIEKMGAKVIEQYALLGSYDFVNILEAPDNETMHRVITELGSRGTHYSLVLPAIEIENFIQSMKT